MKMRSPGMARIESDVDPSRQGVEGVEDQPDVGMVGAADDLPGVAMVVDVAAPGQRLVADAQAALRRALAELAEVGGGAVDAAERERRDVGADQHQVGAELAASGRTCARRGRRRAIAAARACPRNRGTAGTA